MPRYRSKQAWDAILSSLRGMFYACVFVGTGFTAEKPELTRLFPSGGQVGTTVDVEATGKFPVWPIQAWSDTSLIEWTCLKDSGKFQAKIAANTEPGLHWLRLHDENGATSVRPFLVGQAPERNEVEPNDRPSEANKIDSLPQTIQGILNKRADVDLFAVSLEKGQILASTVDSAKWLQSPADVNLQMLDSKGFVLAENLDHVGLDPYLQFNAPRAGTYFVRVFGFPATPDSTVAFSGGNDWNYRLRMDSKASPFGNWLDFEMQSELAAGRIESVAGENVSYEQALPITLPAKIGGVLTEARQANYLRFTARAGRYYRIRIFAREFGSSLDATVAILDAKGKQLAQQDDLANDRDPDLRWKAPSDGEYLIEINDFHRLGGAGYRFVAFVEERPANFSLSIANDLIASNIGKETDINVSIDRESDFKGTINITAEGLPTTSECSIAESKDGSDTSKKVTLKLKSTAAFQGPISIVGKANELPDMVRKAVVPKGKTVWLSVTGE